MTTSATLVQKPSSSDDKLRESVTAAVRSLQKGYLSERREFDVTARLARLRRAITSEPGSIPAVWQDTIGTLDPDLLNRDDTPSPYEYAAHSAITLFALHQQAAAAGMHKPGISLGRAVRQLGRHTGNEEAVRKRFMALATSETREELLHHLRGLITQLRSAGVPLDYGRLAVDLRRLQTAAAADGVRLSWGRDYYRENHQELAAGSGAAASPTNIENS